MLTAQEEARILAKIRKDSYGISFMKGADIYATCYL